MIYYAEGRYCQAEAAARRHFGANDENRDYFIRAVCTFTSGKKKFDAELSLDGQNWALRFQGSTSPTDAAAFCAFFSSEA